MLGANPYESYRQNSVTTASPGELTLMLYEGCIKNIRSAKLHIQNGDIASKNSQILNAQNIIRELLVTLDQSYEISKSMSSLYNYMLQRLIEANIKNDATILDEVEGLVVEFRDTWKQVIHINRMQQYKTGDQV